MYMYITPLYVYYKGVTNLQRLEIDNYIYKDTVQTQKTSTKQSKSGAHA